VAIRAIANVEDVREKLAPPCNLNVTASGCVKWMSIT